MLLALKDFLLNSAFVVENLCGEFKRTINYDKIKLKKLGNFCVTSYMVDFCRPSQIYLAIISSIVSGYY